MTALTPSSCWYTASTHQKQPPARTAVASPGALDRGRSNSGAGNFSGEIKVDTSIYRTGPRHELFRRVQPLLRLDHEPAAVAAPEHLGEEALFGVRGRDEVVAGARRARVVHELMHAFGQPLRLQRDVIVADLALLPRAVVPVEPRRPVVDATRTVARGALPLQLDAEVRVGDAELRVDRLEARGKEVVDGDVLQLRGCDDGDADADDVAELDPVDRPFLVRERGVLVRDGDAAVQCLDVTRRRHVLEVEAVVQPAGAERALREGEDRHLPRVESAQRQRLRRGLRAVAALELTGEHVALTEPDRVPVLARELAGRGGELGERQDRGGSIGVRVP